MDMEKCPRCNSDYVDFLTPSKGWLYGCRVCYFEWHMGDVAADREGATQSLLGKYRGDPKPIDVNKWPNSQGTGPVLFARKLQALGFHDNQISSILGAMETTCSECWDTEIGGGRVCHCENDE